MKERFRAIGLVVLCLVFLLIGGYELYGWYETGHIEMHSGSHRLLSYSAEPFQFIWEFGTYSLMVFMALLGIVGCFYFRLWR
jgi:Zn-dependent protease